MANKRIKYSFPKLRLCTIFLFGDFFNDPCCSMNYVTICNFAWGEQTPYGFVQPLACCSHCVLLIQKLCQDLHKLEQYLPLLENLIFHVDLVSSNQRLVQWTSELKIRWSSALSSSYFFNLMGPKFYQIDNLRFELGMILFLYGAILRERALEILQAGWHYHI